MCLCGYIYIYIYIYLYIYISFFRLLFNDIIMLFKKVCELIVYLCNDTGNHHTGGSDIFMALCIIHFSLIHIKTKQSMFEIKFLLSVPADFVIDGILIFNMKNIFSYIFKPVSNSTNFYEPCIL